MSASNVFAIPWKNPNPLLVHVEMVIAVMESVLGKVTAAGEHYESSCMP
jgi:hypothetical protein